MASVDHAVSLVQAYLQLNGYFTSAEYPIIASAGRSGVRTITDIDVLAFRFPRSLPLANPSRKRSPQGLNISDIDPGLGVPDDTIDMPDVVRCPLSVARDEYDRQRRTENGHNDRVIRELLRNGASTLPSGVVVRLVACGSFPPGAPVPPCRIVSLGHVLEFLQSYVRRHWHVLRHLQFKGSGVWISDDAGEGAAGWRRPTRRGRSGGRAID